MKNYSNRISFTRRSTVKQLLPEYLRDYSNVQIHHVLNCTKRAAEMTAGYTNSMKIDMMNTPHPVRKRGFTFFLQYGGTWEAISFSVGEVRSRSILESVKRFWTSHSTQTSLCFNVMEISCSFLIILSRAGNCLAEIQNCTACRNDINRSEDSQSESKPEEGFTSNKYLTLLLHVASASEL